jgi:hypothetical protein
MAFLQNARNCLTHYQRPLKYLAYVRGPNILRIVIHTIGHRIDSHADRSKSGSSAASSTRSREYHPLSCIVQCRDCFERPPLFDLFERPCASRTFELRTAFEVRPALLNFEQLSNWLHGFRELLFASTCTRCEACTPSISRRPSLDCGVGRKRHMMIA